MPVLDFRKRLRAYRSAAPAEQRIIIANLDGRTTGLIVDGASEVIRVSDEMIEPVPHLVAELGAGYIEGVINLNGRFIALINLRTALTDDIVGELDDVMKALSRQKETVTPALAV